MNKEALRFIDRLYKDLYLDEQVLHHGNGNKYDKFNNIKSYLEKLEVVHSKAVERNHINLLKKLYYDKYVIKKEDIPESYYEHTLDNDLAKGLGYTRMTENRKLQIQEEVINNQKSSLDTWLDYLLSEDARVYPFWAKYWAFQGMLKLGRYDKEKGIFNKRDKNTVSPFVDLNREALAMSIDMIIKLMNKEEIEDKELETLVKTGSFQKIYTYILTKLLTDNKNIPKRNEGKWVKYKQGTDHIPLVKSLQGYNTGWCTAGESTAKSQLQNGDFYVYYTLDENNEYKVPRIAIRMEYGKIAEIRGIAKDQNLESEMEEIVEEKIQEFPDKEEYYKKVSDMKTLTHIYKKHQNKEELIKEELRFLYEIDEKIIGFGYEKDPRIEEILNQRRNWREDITTIFDYNLEQVAIFPTDVNKETIYYYGDLYYDDYKYFKNPISILHGNFISNNISQKNLLLPQTIIGNVSINIRKINKIVFPYFIKGDLNIVIWDKLSNPIILPKKVEGDIILSTFGSIPNIILPERVKGIVHLINLTSIEGLIFPESLTYEISLNGFKITPENIDEYRNSKKR